MMRPICLGLGLVVWLSIAAPGPGAGPKKAPKDGLPSPAELVKLATHVRSSDKKVKSLELAGSMRDEGVHLRFRALYKAPDHFAILVGDGSDGTPLMFAAEHQLLIYDPIRPSVLCVKDGHANLTVGNEAQLTKLKLGFGKDKRIKDGVGLDLKSMCVEPAAEERVVAEGGQAYRLFRTSVRGGTMVFSIDRSQEHPIRGVKVFEKDAHEPFLAVDRIVVDGAIDDSAFQFPDRGRLALNVEVHDWPGDGLLESMGEMALMMRSSQARFGANHPGLRDTIRFPGVRRLRWDEVRENDRTTSAVLRDTLPGLRDAPGHPNPEPIVAGEPGRPAR